jgi:ABC-type uncharacterized transport system substrate-binding protein
MQRRDTGSAKRRVQKNKRKVGRRRVAPTLTADLQKRLAQRTRERDEALEQLSATSEVLKVISASRATHTVPIVFTIVPDPVASGFVASLSRPGGNATGFLQFEYRLSGKWLELLKEIAPNVTRAAVLLDSAAPAGAQIQSR